MNIKVDLKKLFAAAVSAIMCLSAGGCYLLPDEEVICIKVTDNITLFDLIACFYIKF